MPWFVDNLVYRPDFDYSSQIEHRDVIGEVADYFQVVRYENVREGKSPL